MTLQPMTTAPRDGSEVLLVCSAVYTSWGKLQRVSALWNGHAWDDEMSGEHPDSAFVGWLDIEALVRDSARLDWLEKDAESCVERGEFPNTRLVTRFALVHAAFLVPNRPTVRAAIDKEMGK